MKNYFTSIILIFLVTGQAMAGVVVGGTRFIYPQDKKMITIPVDNTDKKTAYLIQGWIEKEDGITKSKNFILTPVLFRLDAGKKGILRVMLKQAAFPDDRESLLWLNVRGIPETEERRENKLQVVINSKFKFFYRPRGITEPDYNNLRYERSGNKINIINDTPFHITVRDVTVNNKEHTVSDMIVPFESLTVPVTAIHNKDKITISYISDFGGIISKPVTFKK
ncbi:chaperone protein fimC precursor [Morganella morganii]|uniref:Molecular chaperone n=1 Tax=Morganella morganii TaxID=582 RepID=A0A9Q4CP57_MORMO|nr:molecular chaperone [Morganella morganii]EJD6037975.1 molecular chaperone [Morganella morganii]KKY64354.1 chaperone protein fimC precursor [Morganella morganii]KOO19454.1 chaperone protein fimC precursor [Morganella morganii]MBS9543585.1 molecular chaperone [Morganella morganii subsp. morganii]MCY0790405.1 molecular chaperone [Morganella morganii]